jgi:hypothetical protein
MLPSPLPCHRRLCITCARRFARRPSQVTQLGFSGVTQPLRHVFGLLRPELVCARGNGTLPAHGAARLPTGDIKAAPVVKAGPRGRVREPATQAAGPVGPSALVLEWGSFQIRGPKGDVCHATRGATTR